MLALGANGLVNAQFIVRDDGVYLIEVNPRASRTVPFLSKVTGVPDGRAGRPGLARRDACRSSAGTAGCCRPRRSSRSRRRRSRRPSCAASTRPSGPGCSRRARSSASTRTRASRWPRRCSGAALVPPRPGDGRRARAALDRGPRQGPAAAAGGRPGRRRLPIRRDPGHAPAAGRGGPRRTSGRQARRGGGRAIGEVPILDLIASGDVRLVVNTPTPRSGAVRDAAEIRLAATAEGILCLTAIETAVAAAEALDPDHRREVRASARWTSGSRRRGQPRLAVTA